MVCIGDVCESLFGWLLWMKEKVGRDLGILEMHLEPPMDLSDPD